MTNQKPATGPTPHAGSCSFVGRVIVQSFRGLANGPMSHTSYYLFRAPAPRRTAKAGEAS